MKITQIKVAILAMVLVVAGGFATQQQIDEVLLIVKSVPPTS